MVLRSHVRESRSYAEKPEPESRPEAVSRPEMELTKEMEIAALTSVREGFGATRPDTVAEVMQRDKPEVVLTFPLQARQEMHTKTSSAFRTRKLTSSH